MTLDATPPIVIFLPAIIGIGVGLFLLLLSIQIFLHLRKCPGHEIDLKLTCNESYIKRVGFR